MQYIDCCFCQFWTNINNKLFELTPKKIENPLRNINLQKNNNNNLNDKYIGELIKNNPERMFITSKLQVL